MSDFFHPVVMMPPFPSADTRQPQFSYTAPLPQRPFPPLRTPMHVGCYSISSTHSFAAPPAPPPPSFASSFEKAFTTEPFERIGPALPIDVGFGFSRDDRRASVAALTLAPLTCSKSTIHIVVHENGKTQKFAIHRELLCFYSPYFRRALADSKVVTARIRRVNHRREWRWEDRESVDEVMEMGGSGSADAEAMMDVDVVIKLPHVIRKEKDKEQPDTKESEDEEGDSTMEFADIVRELKIDTEELGGVTRGVLAAFVSWLYHGYPGLGLLHYPSSDSFDAVTLIQLWVLAGRLGVPECQNDCIEGIEWWRMKSNIIQTSMLGWIYHNTREYEHEKRACGLRSLLIDQCTWKLDGNWLLGTTKGVKNEKQFPRQALVDLVSRMRVVLNENVSPPFSHSELRRNAYWVMDGQDDRVSDVL